MDLSLTDSVIIIINAMNSTGIFKSNFKTRFEDQKKHWQKYIKVIGDYLRDAINIGYFLMYSILDTFYVNMQWD